MLRVRPTVDHASRSFGIDTAASLQPWKASLLCHSHDEKLWNLRSFVVAGELSRDGDRWVLRPDRFIPGGDSMGPVAMVKAFRELRGTARRYLERRGLARPEISWSEFDSVKADLEEAEASSPAPAAG